MKIEKIGRILTLFFIAALPWSVMISVIGVLKFDIQILRYWKEVFLMILFFVFAIEVYKKRISFQYDNIDILIFLFSLCLIIVTIFNNR